MTWFRKHWPDLLILFFIVLILAGAVLILFGGTKRLFNLSSDQPSMPVEQSAPEVQEIPLNPPPQTETVEPVPTEPQTQTSELSQQPEPESAATQGTTETENPAETTQSVPVIPAEPQTSTTEKPAANPETAQTTDPQKPAATQPSEPQKPAQQTPEVTKPAVQAISGRAPTKQDYRISAGLFDTEAQAGVVAEKIKALGYPTYVFPSKDETFVVLVGPFVNRADADTAVSQIQPAHQNLFVYAPQNAPASTSTATPATTPSPTTSANTTTNGPVYLQVGAYKRADSAMPAVEQLRGLGLNPSLRSDTGGMVRVVVGPIGAAELQAVQSKLNAAGYTDAFQVR
ncbi:SPOR domain-containing protein [Deinococcus misasensis]|uniref:SPOR domain-containing protein n=1 Tax=Deinococcus misasensis TaxID=392413 RepID=UPI00054FDA6E|nr:SPOR domain-containing protein [Deinococcus misasensis]